MSEHVMKEIDFYNLRLCWCDFFVIKLGVDEQTAAAAIFAVTSSQTTAVFVVVSSETAETLAAADVNGLGIGCGCGCSGCSYCCCCCCCCLCE